jgi:hypothetical protein
MFSISEEHAGEGLLRGGALPKVHENPLVLVIFGGDKFGQTVVLRLMVYVENRYRHLLEHQDQLQCVHFGSRLKFLLDPARVGVLSHILPVLEGVLHVGQVTLEALLVGRIDRGHFPREVRRGR